MNTRNIKIYKIKQNNRKKVKEEKVYTHRGPYNDPVINACSFLFIDHGTCHEIIIQYTNNNTKKHR